jgi:hypothetical protein
MAFGLPKSAVHGPWSTGVGAAFDVLQPAATSGGVASAPSATHAAIAGSLARISRRRN